jgi:hypothetical protein
MIAKILILFAIFFFRYGAKTFRTPVDFLKLFLTEALVFSICVATNQYADVAIARGERLSYSSQKSWQPLGASSEEELYRYLYNVHV